MKSLKLAAFLFMAVSCGTSNDVNVDGGTENQVTAEVNYTASICEDERFTAKQKLKCIELITNPEVTAQILSDELTDEQLDALLGL
ncbi:MAG: hypothetical protein GY920_20180 [Aliivibrio sp.]|nr:hypothetical protein [Aliivibrio sp.]MCP4322146.1 hypothetical protein [Alteromonadales bacterium]